ncbi:MAG TPA: PKD domain-containing protein, partial [Anaerolineales bacterium]|nr:PKD domain-containing protein [Anaerolineales bacterium]
MAGLPRGLRVVSVRATAVMADVRRILQEGVKVSFPLLLALLLIGPYVAAADVFLVFPKERWEKGFDLAADVVYGVAATPAGGAVVAGTAGVVAYDIDGNLLWKADYPGIAYAVVLDKEGNILVAGTAGLVKLDPRGNRLWERDGEYTHVCLAPGGLIIAASGNRLIALDGERELWEIELPHEPLAVAAGARELVVGTTEGVVVLDPDTKDVKWAAPALGELRDVVLSSGRVYVVGSLGVRAYNLGGALLWEAEFPGEAAAGAIYSGPEGTWLVVAGLGPRRNKAGLVAYSPENGELVWKLWERAPKGTVSVRDVAAASGAGVFYVAGTEFAEDPDYLTSQYVLASPSEGAPPRGCPVTADFSFSPEAPLSGEEVGFTDRSRGEVVAWAWDFGDGTGSRVRDPVHAYASPGVYTVTLTVADASGCVDTVRKSIEIGNRPPEVVAVEYGIAPRAAFSWEVEREVHGRFPDGFSPDGATDLDDVIFVDGSGPGPVVLRAEARDPNGEVVAYEWDLDADGTVDAEGAEVTWDFGEPGVYPITLMVVDDRGARGRYEGFVDTQEYGIVAWEWDFGDGETSGEQHPSHWFRDDGVYEVTLTVWDEFGNSASVTEEVPIENVPPVAGFTYEVQPGGGEVEADFTWSVDRERHGSYPEGFTPEGATDLDDILFEDLSTVSGGVGGAVFTAEAVDHDGEVVKYEWDFDGDGVIDAEGEAVEWVPPEAGTYRITLIVTDDDGDSTVYEEDVWLEAGG